QSIVLEVDGQKIPQSLSIARFVAKQFNLAGKDNLEQAKTDAVIDTIAETAEKLGPLIFEEDESKKQIEMKRFITDDLPKQLKDLDTLQSSYGQGAPYFVGNSLTWADLSFYDVSQCLLDIDQNVLEKYPKLKRNREEVAKQPKVAAYLRNRPETSF
ncbi:unnamed protein product, partial [Didymodactylos carnosus]